MLWLQCLILAIIIREWYRLLEDRRDRSCEEPSCAITQREAVPGRKAWFESDGDASLPPTTWASTLRRVYSCVLSTVDYSCSAVDLLNVVLQEEDFEVSGDGAVKGENWRRYFLPLQCDHVLIVTSFDRILLEPTTKLLVIPQQYRKSSGRHGRRGRSKVGPYTHHFCSSTTRSSQYPTLQLLLHDVLRTRRACREEINRLQLKCVGWH